MAKVEVDIAEYDLMRSQLKQLESDKTDLELKLNAVSVELEDLKKVKNRYIIKTITTQQKIDKSKAAQLLILKVADYQRWRPDLSSKELIETCIEEASFRDVIEFTSKNESIPELDLEKFKGQLALELKDEVKAEHEETIRQYEEFNEKYQEKVKELLKKENQARNAMKDYEYQKADYEERKKTLEKKFKNKFETEIEERRKELEADFEVEIDNLKQTINTNAKTISSLKTQLDEALLKVTELEGELSKPISVKTLIKKFLNLK